MDLIKAATDYYLLVKETTQIRDIKIKIKAQHRVTQYTKIEPDTETIKLLRIYDYKLQQSGRIIRELDRVLDGITNPDVREVMQLSIVQNKTTEEIATETYRSVSTVNRLKAIGKTILQQRST